MGFLLPLIGAASAIFPGAAPVLGAVGTALRAFGVGGTTEPGAPAGAPIPPDFASLGTALAPQGISISRIGASTGVDVPIGTEVAPSVYAGGGAAPPSLVTDLGIGAVRETPEPIGMLAGAGTGLGVAAVTGGDIAMLGPAIGTAVTAIRAALPEIAAVVPKWLLRTAGYAALSAAIYEEYKRLRGLGISHKRARHHALLGAGIRVRRRRMRPTNVHALRRAIRRVHGFQRVARKVGALHVGRRRLLPSRVHHRRMYRRGDLSPFLVEDTADMLDEAEDYGIDPDYFPDEAYAE